MPAWLFSRGRRKQSMSDKKKYGREQASPAMTDDAQGLHRRNSRTQSRRKRRKSSKSSLDGPTQKEAEFSLASAPIDIPNQKQTYPPTHGSVEDITALPVSHVLGHSPHLRPVTRQTIHIPYTFQLHADSRSGLRSTGSLPLAMLGQTDIDNHPPSRQASKLLRKTRSTSAATRLGAAADNSMPRRKLSKRKDLVREEEIRAMTAPIPMKRPAAHSGGLLRRDSKKMRHGMNRHFERPSSEISLPMEESLHSSISGSSEQRSYKVSAFEVFTARPRIRYSSSPPFQSHFDQAQIWEQIRSDSRKDRRAASEQETSRHHSSRRIGDLAEDMDASSLREIMERDRRRKERKRKQDEERLRQRLERRAEKQRAKEQRREPETGVLEKKKLKPGLIGLGIQQPDPSTRPIHPLEREAAEAAAAAASASTSTENVTPEDPMQLDHHEGRCFIPAPAISASTPPPEVNRNPVVADAEVPQPATPPQTKVVTPPTPPQGHTRVNSNISQLPALASEMMTPPMNPAESPNPNEFSPGKEKRSSDQSSSRRLRFWSALFRRGTSKRRSLEQGRTTPSEASFSNTSRESMSRQPLPAHLVQPPPVSVFTRKATGTPTRTRSKFREDLPELPLSPPDSRVQSPEARPSSPRPIPARRGHPAPSSIETDAGAMSGISYGSTSFGGRMSPESPSELAAAAGGIMSQSLASVDSEGSWLSGKPVRRRSAQPQGYLKRSSANSARAKEDFNPSYEELGIPDDEYFRRLTRGDDNRKSGASGAIGRKPSSSAIGELGGSDNEEEAGNSGEAQREVLHSGVARKPTVVHSHAHVKSREGLLNEFLHEGQSAVIEGGDEPTSPTNDEDDSAKDSPGTDVDQDIKLQRATSIDLGKKRARHLSAGSAKLLVIPAKRASRGHSSAAAE